MSRVPSKIVSRLGRRFASKPGGHWDRWKNASWYGHGPHVKAVRSCCRPSRSMTQSAGVSFAKVLLVPLGGFPQCLIGRGIGVVEQCEKDVSVAVRENGYVVLMDGGARVLHEGRDSVVAYGLSPVRGGGFDYLFQLNSKAEIQACPAGCSFRHVAPRKQRHNDDHGMILPNCTSNGHTCMQGVESRLGPALR
jgi:hypothetical protein